MRVIIRTLALFALLTGNAHAQGGLLWQGIADVETWKTDSASFLLARGSGKPSALMRFDSWAAIEPIRNVILFGEIFLESGAARTEPGHDAYFKQGGIRYSPSDAFVVEAGRIPQIVGIFSSRILSYRNPLIGIPDGYSTTYPAGARVDGSAGIFDYRAGVTAMPMYRDGYTPAPSSSARAAIGGGISPATGIRFGASAMSGPYLNSSFSTALLGNRDWKTYGQRILAGDIEISRGYFEATGEFARSWYDVPGYPSASKGLAYYLESKYTVAPRVFLATRFERNDYPFIAPVSATSWISNNAAFSDLEVGGGFRPTATTILKMTVRADHWSPNANPFAPHDNGYALAFQLSQFIDFAELMSPGHFGRL